MTETIVLGTLISINAVVLIITIFTGGMIMSALQAAIQALNAAVTALQGRIGSGVVVQQADLDNATSAISAAATALGAIAP